MSNTDEIIKAFLESIRFEPPGGKTSFFTGGEHGSFSGIGITLYIDLDKRKQAAILLAKRLPTVFSGKPISDVTDLLSKFLMKDFASEFDVASFLMERPLERNLADRFPRASYDQVWRSLESYIDKLRKVHLHMFPAHKIQPIKNVVFDEVLLLRLDADLNAELKPRIQFHNLKNGWFPPIEGEKWRYELEMGDCWVGCFTQDKKFPPDKIRAVAGAIFMAAPSNKSRTFNAAKSKKGWLSMSESECSFGLNDPIIPPLYYPIELGITELEFLENLLVRQKDNERIAIALKNIYKGWITKDRERFISFAIAFDALFGIKNKVTQSISAGMQKHAYLISNIEQKSKVLINMRHALAHGSSMSVAACPGYMDYLEQFGTEPADEQFEILRACMWSLASIP